MRETAKMKIVDITLNSPQIGIECIFCGRFVPCDLPNPPIMCEECRQALSEMIAEHKPGMGGDMRGEEE